MKNQTKQIIGMGYVVFDNSYCKELKYGIDSSLSGLNGVEPRVYIITSMPYREKCYKWREKSSIVRAKNNTQH